jgi:pimeloyl-ACP methyl ester carboxylesterase
MQQPRETKVRANGLVHHLLEWAPSGRATGETILCAHGFLDVGRSFQWVATALADEGHRVVAFDWRGHGESEWLPAGAYYHFFDYIADLSELISAVGGAPLTLVGHSMGGTASVLFSASFPEAVRRLVLLEGLGPEAPEPVPGPDRTRRWVESVRRVRARPPRPMASVGEAAERLLERNHALPRDRAEAIAGWSVRQGGDGLVWSFDPVHRTRGPYPFRPELFLEFLRSLEMPILSIDGADGYRTEDHEARVLALSPTRRVTIPGAGHMLHWEAAEEVAREIDAFVRT